MDKKSLKKHHFWILLAIAIILIPVVLGGAWLGVGSRAADAQAKIDKMQKDLTSQAPKTNEYRAKLDEQKAELEQQKTKIWKEAYGVQGNIVVWPAALSQLNDQPAAPGRPAKLGKYFGDPVDSRDRSVFRSDDVYKAEYAKLPAIIAPTEFNEPGLNEIRAWDKPTQVMRHVPKWEKLPTDEEVWLALEDLCVQREILHDIHAVNQMLARFLPVPRPPREPAKLTSNSAQEKDRYQHEMKTYTDEKHKFEAAKALVDKELIEAYKPQPGEVFGRFISPYWQLDLVVGKVQGSKPTLNFRGKLTNVSGRRQNVARIEFKVWLSDPNRQDGEHNYVLLPVQSEFLAAGASEPINESRSGPADTTLKTIYRVEQRLDQRFAPVKRVDKIALGYPSHRFAKYALNPSSFSKEEMDKVPQTTDTANAGAGTEGASGRFGSGGAAGGVNFTQNGLPRLRYLEPNNKQVRRMPVGIVMIVDQGHIQDVIRALANSRLRFQNTQIHYERFRGAINLSSDASPSMAGPVGGDSGGDPTLGIVPGGRSGGRGAARGDEAGGGGGRGGPIAPGRPSMPFGNPVMGQPSANQEEETANNLVELTVYGLISLYEKFPPKPTGTPGTPEAGQPQPSAPAVPTQTAGVPVPPPPTGAPVPPPATGPSGGLPPPPPAGDNPTANPTPKPPMQ